MKSISDSHKFLFTSVVGAFVGGVGVLGFLDAKIDQGVKRGFQDPENQAVLPRGLQGLPGEPGISIPIGSVLAYAGPLVNEGGVVLLPPDVRKSFEICDGNLVTTEGSPVLGLRKPDLLGKFIRGMREEEFGNLLKPGKERTYPQAGTNELVLDHNHDQGTLASMYAIRNGGWVHFNLTTFPTKVNLQRGQGGQPNSQSTGDLTTDQFIQVRGDTGFWRAKVDNRPEHSALIYIVRTK